MRRQGHLQDHEACARLEHARGFPESVIEVDQVPHAPSDHRSVEGPIRKREDQRIGDHRREPGRLVPAKAEHALDEVGPDDPTPEPASAGEHGAEVEGAGAQIQIHSLRRSLPPQSPHRVAPPPLIQPQADDAVEPVVRGRDGREHVADVSPLLGPAGNG